MRCTSVSRQPTVLIFCLRGISGTSTMPAQKQLFAASLKGWAINARNFAHQKNWGIYHDQRFYCRRNPKISCRTCGTIRQRFEENLRGIEKTGKSISKRVCSFRPEPVAIKAGRQQVECGLASTLTIEIEASNGASFSFQTSIPPLQHNKTRQKRSIASAGAKCRAPPSQHPLRLLNPLLQSA